MTKFGLSQKTIEMILKIFENYPELEAVKVFGSRAKGNYKTYSDIDFVIWGDLDSFKLGRLILDLDELETPYTFDVKLYSEITHLKLKEHIDRVGKIFYKRKN